jgi:hypothetical protein
MTTSLQYFRVVAKQFATVIDADVQTWLDIATLNANTACLVDDRLNLALALYAAHMLALDDANQVGEGGRGDVKSEREGDLARSYGLGVNNGTWLGLTGYGQQYNNMLLGCVGATIMTRFGSGPFPNTQPALYADDINIFDVPRNLY